MTGTGIPQGFHTLSPYMIIRDAAKAIEFYKQALGATELFRWEGDDGAIRHAEIMVGNSPIMITGENPDWPEMKSPLTLGGSPVHLFLYVEDVDTFFERAVAAGAKVLMAVEDQRDGDRRGGFIDPFGYTWWVATQIEDITREELQQRYDSA